MTIRNALLAVSGLAVLGALAAPALSQQPLELKIMAPAAPGGGWDQTARSMQQALVQAGIARSAQVTNVAGAECCCTPEYSYFDLQLEATAPGEFNLTAPEDSSLYNTIARTMQDFAWTIPSSQVPDDILSYDLHFWLGDTVPGGEEFIVTDLDSNEAAVAIDLFQLYNDYLWRVNCHNR